MPSVLQNESRISNIRNKKIFLLLTLLISGVIILIIAFILYLNTKGKQASSNTITAEISSEALKLEPALSSERVKDALKKVNNAKLSDEERYKELANIYFYFSAAYSNIHDPSIRTFVNSRIDSYAKKTFPKLYQEGDFIIPCADSHCGKPIDNEIKEIIDIISKSNLSTDIKDVIVKNLTTTGYIINIEQAKSGYSIVLLDLDQASNAQASKAAILLRNYIKDKYNIEL